MLLAAFPALAAVPIPASGEVVGRAWLAAAGVADRKVSARHVCFFHSGGRLQVEDVGSRNGMYIGGARIRPGERVDLDDGDVLRLGRTLLVYREAFTGAESPEPPLGQLVGPWGLTALRAEVESLRARCERNMLLFLNVLLQGETGTGKELLAEVVVEALGRGGKPFTAVNMASIPVSMFEGQLFGWKKGSYSGALSDSRGVIRAHEGGAVFLDEIGELPLEVQPKLLRLLQNREISPVGEDRAVKVEVALIAATNRPLDAMVKEHAFRLDLMARFPVQLDLPPLRDRPEDVFEILQNLRSRRSSPFDPKTAEVEAVERLMLETWPANVRDLDRLAAAIDLGAPLTRDAVDRVLGPPAVRTPLAREAAERMLADCEGNPSEAARRLGVSHRKLCSSLAAQPVAADPPPELRPKLKPKATPGGALKAQLQQVEKQLYEEMLRKTHGNLMHAARLLGKSRSTVGRKLKKFGIELPER